MYTPPVFSLDSTYYLFLHYASWRLEEASCWALSWCAGMLRLQRDAETWSDLLDLDTAQCFVIVLPPPDANQWHGYPFINNVHFAASPEVEEFLTENYGYAIKTDFDTFLSPSLFHFWPDRWAPWSQWWPWWTSCTCAPWRPSYTFAPWRPSYTCAPWRPSYTCALSSCNLATLCFADYHSM